MARAARIGLGLGLRSLSQRLSFGMTGGWAGLGMGGAGSHGVWRAPPGGEHSLGGPC